MARLVVFAAGTLGDHLPVIALARAVQDRGHDVRLLLNEAMRGHAERAGLEAVAIGDVERGPEEARANAWAWNHWQAGSDPSWRHPKAQPMRFEALLEQVREMARQLENADLLLATAIRPHGMLAHLATGVPWATFSLNPASFQLPRSPEDRRLVWRQVRDSTYDDQVLLDWTLEALGRKRLSPAFRRGMLWAEHVLLGSSRHFFAPDLDQLQPFSRIDQTGFWFYEGPEWRDWRPSQELERFCERKPIVLSFSSQPLEDPGAALRKHVEAARRLRMPLAVQRGWADFREGELPDDVDAGDVFFLDFAPHDWLFARASCAVQHGGIGSLARALRQFCPVLVEPFGNDQFFNAGRVAALGCGASLHPFESSSEDVARAIFEEVLPERVRRRAEEIGTALRREDGLAEACRMIEGLLERRARAGGERSRLWNGVWPLSEAARKPSRTRRRSRRPRRKGPRFRGSSTRRGKTSKSPKLSRSGTTAGGATIPGGSSVCGRTRPAGTWCPGTIRGSWTSTIDTPGTSRGSTRRAISSCIDSAASTSTSTTKRSGRSTISWPGAGWCSPKSLPSTSRSTAVAAPS